MHGVGLIQTCYNEQIVIANYRLSFPNNVRISSKEFKIGRQNVPIATAQCFSQVMSIYLEKTLFLQFTVVFLSQFLTCNRKPKTTLHLDDVNSICKYVCFHIFIR